MRIEALPLILGGLLGLISLALLFDAWAEDGIWKSIERRRRPRLERDRKGEALLGLGVMAMAAAFVGRDTWKYSVLTVIVGAVLMLWGIKRNGAYLRGVFSRG
jgi:hypothetical protein